MSIDCVEIDSNSLKEQRKNTVNIIVDTSKVKIIKGVVLDKESKPCYGASIEVEEFNIKTKVRRILGYTYTDYNGEYAFSLNYKADMNYEVTVYSALN